MAADLRALSTQAAGKASPSVASAMMTQLETEPQTEVEELVARQLPSNMSVNSVSKMVKAKVTKFFLGTLVYVALLFSYLPYRVHTHFSALWNFSQVAPIRSVGPHRY